MQEALDLLPYLVRDILYGLRCGTCSIVSLYQIGAEQDNGSQFLACLNALCQCEDSVAVAEIDDLTYKMLLLGIILHSAKEGPVYFHIIRHIAQQILYIGIA